MIAQRKEGLNKVTNVMSGIRDLGIEFNLKVDEQGARLEDVGNQLDDANVNTKKGADELNQFAEKMKGQGIKTLICLAVLIMFLLVMIYLIFR